MSDWIIDLAKKGKEHQKMLNKARSEFMKGENNPRWNGGISEYPNQPILRKKKIEIFKKVKGKCEMCERTAKIIHHIDEDKSNHSIDNLMALCLFCHKEIHSKKNSKTKG